MGSVANAGANIIRDFPYGLPNNIAPHLSDLQDTHILATLSRGIFPQRVLTVNFAENLERL